MPSDFDLSVQELPLTNFEFQYLSVEKRERAMGARVLFLDENF